MQRNDQGEGPSLEDAAGMKPAVAGVTVVDIYAGGGGS
jgi:hypothetical protein